jgi:hypothetical protein
MISWSSSRIGHHGRDSHTHHILHRPILFGHLTIR